MVKRISKDDPLRSGKVSRRLTLSSNRAKSNIAKDRFAFDQSMQGHDCQKIRRDGDFVVQKRDFFGNEIGKKGLAVGMAVMPEFPPFLRLFRTGGWS